MIQAWKHDGSSFQQIVDRHGPWSAMSIQLADGSFTRPEAPDRRLKRLLQYVSDVASKPLSECRVLDLACLEGHYGIEFAMHGAQSVCVEIREANLAKAAYAIHNLNLSNCLLVRDDVRNLSKEKYGVFDIIICSGILYHLQAADAAALVARLGECCSDVCVVDTYVATREDQHVTVQGRDFGGFVYREHEREASTAERIKDLWASVDNEVSFWFSPRDLVSMFRQAGFTSCVDVLLPTHPELSFDRRMFACIKGRPVQILTSPMSNALTYEHPRALDPFDLHPYQVRRSAAFKLAKRFLPQALKDAIKPTLRKAGLLKTDDEIFPASKGDR